MPSSFDIGQGVTIWILVLALIVLVQWQTKTPRAGLVFAYLANLGLIHLVAPVFYLFPWYFPLYQVDIVQAGFEQSMYAVVAFALGVLTLGPFLLSVLQARGLAAPTLPPGPPGTIRDEASGDASLPRFYVLVGIVSYFILAPLAGRVPTLSALLVAANRLVLVGICLWLWQAWHTRNIVRLFGWLALALIIPFVTVIGEGFLASGAGMFIAIIMFVSQIVRPRWRVIALGLLLSYIGLSAYVTYMRARGEIRAAVWGGSPLEQRLDVIWRTLENFEWFDYQNVSQLQRIDGRLNQNFLVGAAVRYLNAGYRE
ncbi:MAG: hypothetical protein ONB06_12120 [candidate division KSB1 bacterium]|nr:hypothetical protein [candidate division KSB1 bacterium]